jgi:hypothetical protein
MSDADQWQPGDPIHPRPHVDPEVSACEVIDNVFGALDDAARARVLRWATDKYVTAATVR